MRIGSIQTKLVASALKTIPTLKASEPMLNARPMSKILQATRTKTQPFKHGLRIHTHTHTPPRFQRTLMALVTPTMTAGHKVAVLCFLRPKDYSNKHMGDPTRNDPTPLIDRSQPFRFSTDKAGCVFFMVVPGRGKNRLGQSVYSVPLR